MRNGKGCLDSRVNSIKTKRENLNLPKLNGWRGVGNENKRFIAVHTSSNIQLCQ